uniref:Uncharacterized protein n=1 Tax=Amphimedon queenslandica TaxID=400682 RepID=A0A1X7UVP2_AMPQE
YRQKKLINKKNKNKKIKNSGGVGKNWKKL